MYQIAITPISNINAGHSYRKSFNSKREADKWFSSQYNKRGYAKNAGQFYTDILEMSKLY